MVECRACHHIMGIQNASRVCLSVYEILFYRRVTEFTCAPTLITKHFKFISLRHLFSKCDPVSTCGLKDCYFCKE